MSAEITSQTNGRTFAQKASDWLFQQGVSTVLLAAILYVGWKVAPGAVDKVLEAMKDERTEHRTEVKELGETFKWALDRVAPPPVPREIHPGGD